MTKKSGHLIVARLCLGAIKAARHPAKYIQHRTHKGIDMMPSTHTATLPSRVFMNGNSQAVRIPQEFRLDAQRVEITRTASGDLLIHPIREQEDRGAALLRALSGFDDELVQALESSQHDGAAAMQDREAF